eukprot:TRINITY_DN7993_c0_g1_i1.p1 TRINITY_DN7993_c0_g1~~TRINITY_DN7993_c0_g1_i1.p1  ORF type:complete len:227 (+),score=15.60 TRINITY_DN7993_c0_g1_i1:32-712(+)
MRRTLKLARQNPLYPPLLPPQGANAKMRYTVALDVDETLVYTRFNPGEAPRNRDCIELSKHLGGGVSLVRPAARELIKEIGQRCELVLWTAGVASYLKEIRDGLDPEHVSVAYGIARDNPNWWYSPTFGYAKVLQWLGRDMDRCILVDNSPLSCAQNPDHAIEIEDFEGHPDNGLEILRNILDSLLSSDLTVPDYLQSRGELTHVSRGDRRYYRLVPSKRRIRARL